MRWFVPTVLVLAVGCGASAGTDRSPGERTVLASSISGEGLWQQDPFVAKLPVLAVFERGGTTIVLRGFASEARRRAIIRTAARTYADFNRRFHVNKRLTTDRPVDVCIFESQAAYQQAARVIFGRKPFFAVGFYMASHRLVLVDTSRGLGNLRHEIIHPLVKDWFPSVPAWFDEALASLYGTAYARRGRMKFLVNNRLGHLHRAQRRGTAPSFFDLATSEYDDVHGPNERAYYAVGRYLLLYLHRQGRLGRFVREMRSRGDSAEAQLELIGRYANQKTFDRWTRRLRY